MPTKFRGHGTLPFFIQATCLFVAGLARGPFQGSLPGQLLMGVPVAFAIADAAFGIRLADEVTRTVFRIRIHQNGPVVVHAVRSDGPGKQIAETARLPGIWDGAAFPLRQPPGLRTEPNVKVPVRKIVIGITMRRRPFGTGMGILPDLIHPCWRALDSPFRGISRGGIRFRPISRLRNGMACVFRLRKNGMRGEHQQHPSANCCDRCSSLWHDLTSLPVGWMCAICSPASHGENEPTPGTYRTNSQAEIRQSPRRTHPVENPEEPIPTNPAI